MKIFTLILTLISVTAFAGDHLYYIVRQSSIDALSTADQRKLYNQNYTKNQRVNLVKSTAASRKDKTGEMILEAVRYYVDDVETNTPLETDLISMGVAYVMKTESQMNKDVRTNDNWKAASRR